MQFVRQYYQKKYHLRFAHAKKLFAIDMTLLLSVVFLTAATIFWFAYNPFISDKISLTVAPSAHKIRSGDYITYTIEIQNNSDTKLISPEIIMRMPDGFVFDKASPAEMFSAAEHSFALKNLSEKQKRAATISGWSFGVPGAEERVMSELSYQQEKRGIREIKTASLLQTHRGSVLEFTAEMPQKLIAEGAQPITLTIKNNGDKKIDNISLPLTIGPGLKLANGAPNKGEIKDNVWTINALEPNADAVIKARLASSFSDAVNQAAISLTPNIYINNKIMPQETLKQTKEIIHPRLNLLTSWSTNKNYAEPGEVLTLKIKIENAGDIDLQNLNMEIPISTAIVDANRLTKQNYGLYKNLIFSINKNFIAGMGNLPAGQTIELAINLPISFLPQGDENVALFLNPKISGQIKNTESAYETETQTDKIKIGTALNLNAEARYYTDDGDQLGRGPMPPKVGKETKYWTLIKMTNTTNRVADVRFSAALPDYVKWTGKTSVSEGNAIQYNETGKTVSWSAASLLPHSEAGVYFEIAITPTAAQINTSPILVKNISLSGHDEFTGTNIIKTHANLDSSLPADKTAKQKGVKVAY